LLASAGYRVIIPYLRGYGTTRFLASETVRNGQQSVIAVDIIALMDALKIEKATIGGYDWGARTANIIAALWPERCKAMVSVSGYLIGSVAANKMPLPPKAELQWWYQYYFATERGRAGYEQYRHDFAKLIWQIASPKWDFDDATFDRSAAAFDNPDHVSIVIHNYRGGLAWLKASRNTTISKSGLPRVRSSPCPPLPSKAMPMVRRTRTPAPMPRNSPASMRTGSSPAASGIICRRKPRRPSPKLSSKSTAIDRRQPDRFRNRHDGFQLGRGLEFMPTLKRARSSSSCQMVAWAFGSYGRRQCLARRCTQGMIATTKAARLLRPWAGQRSNTRKRVHQRRELWDDYSSGSRFQR
jgi:pimeloyl-ACP methyl ester carboxylesterase